MMLQNQKITEELILTLRLGGMRVKLKNLFGGKKPSLAKTVDGLLNSEKSKMFNKDFQPAMAKAITPFIKKFINAAVTNIGMSDLE